MNADLGRMDNEIKRFRIEIADVQLCDLHQRLARTRWPEALADVGWSYGVPLGYLRELADYWQHRYDWRAAEATLNQLPQFTTQIEGQRVHFVHARSAEPGALPLLLAHGWPGSIVEFQKLVAPLVDPRAHGGDPGDAFHVVCPSLPGFAFSGPTHEPGWDVRRMARAFATLMARLGYHHYGAHGGDFGAAIARELGLVDAERVAGVHLTTLLTFPSEDPFELASLTSEEKARLALLDHFEQELSGFARLQALRPQTLSYALSDSPVGQLAVIVEQFKEWTDSTHAPEDAVDRDQMLSNVMLYWLTGTAGSAARLFRESTYSGAPARSETPTGVTLFPMGLPALRRFAERDNRIVHWTELECGGHFAAMEQPLLLLHELRHFFRRFR